ncbi:RNA polymerase sigma factor [bacterium]|nr:MAG: RNA polymerase sigma factor [bacterium]
MKTDGPDRTAHAVEEAYAEHGAALFRFALRLCGHRDDAEDIVVETFTHAYRQWDAFQGKGERRAWLYGIAVNRFRMSRRRSRHSLETLSADTPFRGPDPMDIVTLETEIARLPTKQREAFLLVKGEGLTAREAAEALGWPLGTVLYEVHRAVHALRRALGEDSAPILLCEVER